MVLSGNPVAAISVTITTTSNLASAVWEKISSVGGGPRAHFVAPMVKRAVGNFIFINNNNNNNGNFIFIIHYAFLQLKISLITGNLLLTT